MQDADQRSPAVDDRVPTSHLICRCFLCNPGGRGFSELWRVWLPIFQIVFVYWAQAVLDSLPAVSTCFERIKEVAIKEVMFKVEFFVTGNLVGKDLFGPNHYTTVQQILYILPSSFNQIIFAPGMLLAPVKGPVHGDIPQVYCFRSQGQCPFLHFAKKIRSAHSGRLMGCGTDLGQFTVGC